MILELSGYAGGRVSGFYIVRRIKFLSRTPIRLLHLTAYLAYELMSRLPLIYSSDVVAVRLQAYFAVGHVVRAAGKFGGGSY